ncbi:signal peptidase I [Nocardioides sp. DS6]|uniref:Signal peptidase I n=1 Tax=Nocardioides eburneus TaxID=3231482 RepID=A0ABV3T2B3_9ACTN
MNGVRALRALWRLVTWLLLGACLACLASAVWWVSVGKHDDGADIAGYRPYVVASGSMAPAFEVDSFVLTHDRPFDEVRKGDVIAFRAGGIGGRTALHRVTHVEHADGRVAWVTVKGDNNTHPDGVPVTRKEYLGTAVLHTNATAVVMQQLHAPHGVLRVVVVPLAVVVLVWVGGRLLLSGRRTVVGRSAVVLALTLGLLASATASYAIYLDRKQDFVTTTLDGVATRYETTAASSRLTLESTSVNGTIDIPRIEVHSPIIEYVAASSLNLAITHYAGPALNQPDNVVLAGHHAWGNLYFTRIDRLRAGDVIWVTDSARRRVKYLVTGHRQVTPDDTSVLRQPKDGKRHLTLISCTYDLRNRYIVDAVAAKDLAADQAPATRAVSPVDVAEASIWPDYSLPAAVGLGMLGLGGGAAYLAARGVRRTHSRGASGD